MCNADITGLLRSHHQGDQAAFDRLMPLVYDRLQVIARRQLSRMWPGHTIDTSALVRDTYLQLVEDTGIAWHDRGHFFAICARTMRRILVDAVRRRRSLKRGGDMIVTTSECDRFGAESDLDLVLAVDQALEQLEAINERLARVVECRFFAGMTEAEAALALNVSLRGVQRDWLRARAWLQKALA